MKKWCWIAPLTVLIDQLLKGYAIAALRPDSPFQSHVPTRTLIPGVLQLRYAENTGMAFSLFSGHGWILGVVSALCILLGWRILRRYRLGTWSRIAAMLMLGGAVGNMIDRLLRGYVVDMFETLLMDFAVFNAADAALTIGTGLMAVSLLFCPEEWRKKDGST